MSYDEDEGYASGGFKMSGYDDDTDEPLDVPEEVNDFGLDDDEDPDNRYT